MKKKLLYFSLLMAIFSCSKNEEIPQIDTSLQQNVLSKEEINAIITKKLTATGDFKWMDENSHTIWSALQHSNHLLTIGYGTSKQMFQRSIASESIKDEIIQLVTENEPVKTASKKVATIYIDETINVIDIEVTNKETIEILLKDDRVRYIEPSNYPFTQNIAYKSSSSSSGCGFKSVRLASADYRTVSPGALVPWSFDKHNIPAAWNYSTGRGITIAIVDTGLSPKQNWMNQTFNDGFSSGRFVQKYGTFIDSNWYWSNNYDGVNDKCGHGTSMAAIATAPRNDNNLPVGVAYNANLVSYRAVENVVINDYHEKKGVADALIALGNRNDVKIISMSIGWPFGIGRIEDAIKYAYNRGKMLIAAGGTSTSFTNGFGVIFPAKMNETVAVTGVKENQQYNECDDCHKGSKIDFTVQMQRTNGTNNTVPVLSYYNGQTNYVGGSSVATATTAGIAALVWAKHPSWSREQVVNKMRQSAGFYPNKHTDLGYGNINALKAVQ